MPTDGAERLPRYRELKKLRKMVKNLKYNRRNFLFEGAVHARTSPCTPWFVLMGPQRAERLPQRGKLEKLRKMVKKSKYNGRNLLFEGAVHASTSSKPRWIIWMPTDAAESLPRCRELEKLRKTVKKLNFNGTTHYGVLGMPAYHPTLPGSYKWGHNAPKSSRTAENSKNCKKWS